MKRDNKIIKLCTIALNKEQKFKEFLEHVFQQIDENEKQKICSNFDFKSSENCEK